MSRPPHILIFNPDEWRGDALGHTGNPAAVTPNLDALVQTQAVSFRGFCQNTICIPSRCSFMTGWYPHVRGHRTGHYMLRNDEPCLLRILKENGYYVAWCGKNDLVPAQHGFEKYCHVKFEETEQDLRRWGYTRRHDWPWNEVRGTRGDDTFYSFYVGRLDKRGEDIYLDQDWAWVLGAIDTIRSRPADQPLCLFVPLSYPHCPYAVEEPFYSQIDRRKLLPRIPWPSSVGSKASILAGIHQRLNMDTWTEDRWTELRATYYGMCARVDHQFGMVVTALKQAGIYDDTAIFFFSDHGDFAGDYGLVEKTNNTFEDCLTRVPFIIKPPAQMHVQPGVHDALVELVDFPATVYDLAGIKPGYTHFGKSLLALLNDPGASHRDAVFCEGGRLRGERPGLELAHNPTLDPDDAYWPRFYVQRNDYRADGKAVMCRTHDFKYVKRLYERDELYDLKRDPAELCNVAQRPEYASVVATLKDRVLQHLLETGDAPPHDADDRWPGQKAAEIEAQAEEGRWQ